jgi:Protein of unknown function (DUF2510)
MFEYASVSASAYDTTSLVSKINEQAAAGWEVVTIVATGGDVTAFLKREAGDDRSTNGEVAAVAEVVAVSEPAGWGAEPEPMPDEVPAEGVVATETAFIEATTVEAEPAAAAAPVSSVPAGWHPDPSKRYEMRYWDGEKWTEYVSSQGQTYTDPPVA